MFVFFILYAFLHYSSDRHETFVAFYIIGTSKKVFKLLQTKSDQKHCVHQHHIHTLQ